MTGPVTTEALVEKLARDLAREGGWNDPDAPWTENQVIIARGGAGEPVWREYLDDARSLLGRETFTSLLAAHQQVTAERDAEKARADRIDAKLGELNAAVRECLPPVDTLIAERQAAEAALATANAELDRLRAEGEAKDRALKEIAEHPETSFVPHFFAERRRWAFAWRSNFQIVRGIARTALARAATAREGA